MDQAEIVIARLLRWGVWTCAILILFGWILSIANPAALPQVAAGDALSLLRQGKDLAPGLPFGSLTDFRQALGFFRPDAWMTLGLGALIALPILRVGMTIVLFALERDKIFMFLSSTVFAILVFSVVMGRAI